METEQTKNGILEHWTPQEAAEAYRQRKIIFIDVRTVQEYLMERIEGALLSPMPEIRPNHLPAQTERRVVFHCGSGKRSEKVALACLAAGETRIAHVKGGFGAWKEAGLPYIGTDMATGGPTRINGEI